MYFAARLASGQVHRLVCHEVRIRRAFEMPAAGWAELAQPKWRQLHQFPFIQNFGYGKKSQAETGHPSRRREIVISNIIEIMLTMNAPRPIIVA